MAWKRRDLAATFRWSRLLGGRRWGAKKRDYRAMSAALPLKKAWKDEWTKPGAEGGMGAVELESWSEWRIQTRDLKAGHGGVEEQLPHCKKREEPAQPERLLQNSPCLP